MSYSIEVASFCASYYGVYEIRGSKPGTVYAVSLNGAEQAPQCTCPAFKFAKAEAQNCKHIERVWQEACLWNSQWHDGNVPAKLTPIDYDDYSEIPDATCPCCGGPVVAVRVAV